MHFDREKGIISVFSRNLENMTVTYPDAIDFLKHNTPENIKSFIFDCEIVPYDLETNKILPF